MDVGKALRTCSVGLALLACSCIDARPAASPVTALDVPGRADAAPWVTASGSFVAVAWGATADGRTDVFVAVSRDAGATFGPPVQVNALAGEARLGGELPPRVVLVPRQESSAPEVVVVWTARGDRTEIKMARSRDGGRTFELPVALQSAQAAGDRGWPAIASDGQGSVHAIWLDHRGMAADRAPGSRHAGHQRHAEHDGVAMAQRSALFYGAAMASAMVPERPLTTGVCYCCKTALAAGPDGSLYAAWRHVFPGNLRDMAFTTSRDGGRTFSQVVRISEDGWAINGCPDDGPALAVDERSQIHVAWPSVINGTDPQGAIFYASSRDGHQFTPRVRVPGLGGSRPAHPQITVDRAGRIFLAWDESVSGRRVAALREVRAQGTTAPSFGKAVILSISDAATYPVLAATAKGLVAVWNSGGDPARVESRLLRMP